MHGTALVVLTAPPSPTGPDVALLLVEEITNLNKMSLCGTSSLSVALIASHTATISTTIGAAFHKEPVKHTDVLAVGATSEIGTNRSVATANSGVSTGTIMATSA